MLKEKDQRENLESSKRGMNYHLQGNESKIRAFPYKQKLGKFVEQVDRRSKRKWKTKTPYNQLDLTDRYP